MPWKQARPPGAWNGRESAGLSLSGGRRRGMVLSDDGHRACLLTLLAFAFMQCEAHFHARLQLLELVVDDAVAVEVNLLSVDCRADKAMVGEELRDGAVGGRFVMLDDTAQPADAILKPALHRIEGVAHRDKHILMGMVLGGVAPDDDLAFGQHEMNGDVVELALMVMAMMRLDDDMAAGDPRVKALQRRGAVADSRFDGLGGRHVAKGDPKRYLHGNILDNRSRDWLDRRRWPLAVAGAPGLGGR